MNRVTSTALLLLPALLGLSGCSYAKFRTASVVKHPAITRLGFKSPDDARMLFHDVNAVYHPDKQAWAITASGLKWGSIQNIEFEAGKTFSVKYYRSFVHSAPNVSVPVEFPNGRKYVAYLDTGYCAYIQLSSDIVLANKLAIFPVPGSSFQGICRIPKLKVGSVCLEDMTGQYEEQQWQFRVLNVPVYKRPDAFLGLGFMASFDYVLFDNVGKEVVFSKDGAFEPDDPEHWTSYPLEIKPDSSSNDRIMVQLPVAGQRLELFFDSCGGKPGLDLSKAQWERVRPYLHVKKELSTHYRNFQEGRLSCQAATVSELAVGEKTLTDVDVYISDDPEYLSMISLGYFQDTVVVLDFVNKLMWIRS